MILIMNVAWKGSLTTLILIGALAGSLTACGSESESGGPSVTASTGIMADITERVAGDDAEVVQVIPDSASPHDFQLSAEDRARIEDSLLLVSNGAGLEAGIPLDELGVAQFILSENVGELLPSREAGAEDEHAAAEGEDEHGGSDPHVWMDPARVAAALPALAEALARADPEHADGYRQRARAFAAELRQVDAEIRKRVEGIPEPDRQLVTSHDAMGYFADRYGFEVVATPFSAAGPEAEPSAQTIDQVEDAVVSSGVRTVFAQETDDPEVLRQVAEDTGVLIEEHLLVEAPGNAGSYVEMLRRDAELIVAGLTGAPAQPESREYGSLIAACRIGCRDHGRRWRRC
jgi:zinc/manganese transport system substrate-binding protein